jgi:hypothetical protein
MVILCVVLGVLLLGVSALAFIFYAAADLTEDELVKVEDKYDKLVQRFNETNQKLHLYDYLLYDANDSVTVLCNSLGGNLFEDDNLDNMFSALDKIVEIANEYAALQDKKTIGYYYSGNKEEDARLLKGYELIKQEEPAPKPTMVIDEDWD